MILTLDASLQAEKGYVARSNQYLLEEEEYILRIRNIFENDFNDKTFKEAIDLIKNSMLKINSLSSQEIEDTRIEEDLVERGDEENAK